MSYRIHILPAIKLTFLCLLLCSVLYPFIIGSIAASLPANMGWHKNEHGYYPSLGQSFHSDKYFWSRPSAVGYNAAGSGGSNKAPGNPEYLAEVKARMNTFQQHNPGIPKNQIPSDLITASGSGLDPHISVQSALVQVPRIARVRNLPQEELRALINNHIQPAFLGFFGNATINVLQLNLSLDSLHHHP